MKFLLLLLLCIPFHLSAKIDTSGIKFEENLSWDQIKAKAKQENKFIFVDCYATWCGPCKMMDREVYTSDSMRDVMGRHFIAVKVQMDTSKNDGDQTKKWYADASALNKTYEVAAYPTFLYFSPKGELVHKGVGYKDVQQFIAQSRDALNPKKQYVTLVRDYEQGKKDYAVMQYLANTANLFGDTRLAAKIANDYINNYLLGLEDEKLYTRENMEFLLLFAGNPAEKSFKFLYQNTDKVNKVLNDSTGVKAFLTTVISKAELDPAIIAADKASLASPDWNRLKYAVEEKYNDYYADRTIIDAKTRWYGYKKNWPEFTKNIVTLVTTYGSSMKNWDLNARAWEIFQYSNNKNEINIAARWMENVVRFESDSIDLLPAALDTYANLLYKAGRKEEAKAAEKKALNIAIKNETPNYIEEFQKTLEKMERGVPL